MSQSEEERFVEEWIAKNVGATGYDADDDHAATLADQLVADAPYDRAAIEAQIGDLTQRMHQAIDQKTEDEMMARDGRTEYSGVELSPEEQDETLKAEAERADRKAD